MALRLFAFKQIHKILGMDCLTSHLSQVNKTIKKRQLAPPAENECPGEHFHKRHVLVYHLYYT